MTRQSRKFDTKSLSRRLATATVILASFVASTLTAFAEDFLSEFEGPEPSWKVLLNPQESRVPIHQRRRGTGKTGGAEFVRINSNRENSPVRLEHVVPAATVLDELEVSLWVKSNHEGFVLEVRVTLPDVIDPKTKAPLTLQIAGDVYQTRNQWQQLKCRTSDRAVSDRLRLLRAKYKLSIDPKSMYVERVVLGGRLPPGDTDISLDDLTLSPLVHFQATEGEASLDVIEPINQSFQDQNSNESRSDLPVEFLLHRLQVEKKPFFPRIVNYHKERPDVLASAGMNVAWVQDYENASVTTPLRRQGLWITSAPPYAKGMDGEPLDSEDASLLPFQANTSPVLFWMLGVRMTTDGKPKLASWTNQIRNADRRFNKRPIAADVIENERLCSRHVDMLGMSRHVVHTNCSFADDRDWMIQRRDQALPDSFCWTWIQTEPAPSLTDLARRLDSRPMFEPEQIRLQVYAALAAGCRGLGFWTTTPLDDDSPAARERMLALTQLNLELDLFEPWIASGGVPQLVSFKVGANHADQPAQGGKNSNGAKTSLIGKNSRTDSKSSKPPENELHAALIRSELGALLLPMWLEDNAQFVPGPMAARNVTIIVPGGGETAAAWEISTTGQLRHLDRETVAGGVQIRLPRFDQTAAVLITTKQSAVNDLNRKILTIQEQSARVSVELAKLKLDRIRQVDQSLQSLGADLKDGWRWLGEAKLQLDKADAALRNQQSHEARIYAGEALQFGRLVQRNHWENAMKRLPSPVTNPWAVSFQSLPEYWKLSRHLEAMGSLDAIENLLPSGEFEDQSTLVAEHWKHEQSSLETVQSSAELYRLAKQGKFCLRISARPLDGETVPGIVPKPPVTIISPGISVHTGQVVKISGWAKIPAPLVGSVDGALIYDSLLGKAGAVRLKAVQDWQRFELIRPVPESQEMTITIALHGLGELMVDDLRVSAFELTPDAPVAKAKSSPIAPAKYSPLDIRRLNPLPKRK